MNARSGPIFLQITEDRFSQSRSNCYMCHLTMTHIRKQDAKFDLDLHCLQEKPADQDPYCLQELIHIWFHTVFERINCLSTVRYKLICSFGQVKFSMDKYILAFYLSLDK